MSLLGQLGRPSGLTGRLVLWRLNRANSGMNAAVLAALAPGEGERVLEIGFGGGALLARVLAETKAGSVAGVDIATLAVRSAERRFAEAVAAGRLELVEGGERSLPFAERAFDKVCCVNVIYFWRDLPVMLGEVRRVLTHGGRFVVGYNERAPDGAVFTPERVERALAAAGFMVERSEAGSDRANALYHCTVATASGAG